MKVAHDTYSVSFSSIMSPGRAESADTAIRRRDENAMTTPKDRGPPALYNERTGTRVSLSHINY